MCYFEVDKIHISNGPYPFTHMYTFVMVLVLCLLKVVGVFKGHGKTLDGRRGLYRSPLMTRKT